MNDPTPSAADRPWSRRIITVPAVLVGALIVFPASIVVLPALALWDTIRLRWRFPTVRVYLFGLVYLAWEVVAMVVGAALWLAAGGGLLLDRPWFQEAHRRLQVIWARSVMANLDRILSLRVEVTGAEHLAPGPVLLFSRHASMLDTLVPIVLADPLGMRCRYVLKHELVWDPALDVIGHRFPNYFVDRSGGNSTEVIAAVGELAAGTGPDDVFVIFPEGTRFTEAKRDRALEKLRSSDDELAARAEKLTHTLPPRSGGPLAALERRPDGADVVFLAHTGAEGLATIGDLIRAVPFSRPLRVELWRVSGSEVPETPKERLGWLYDRWAEVDAWVGDHRV
jgi:1-acyl-sn-glycerol-3-phosphate acyltransferase